MGVVRKLLLVIVVCLLAAVSALVVAGRRSGAGRMTATVDIARPRADVFSWIVEPERQREWMSGIVEARLLTDGPLRVGSRMRQVHDDGRERVEMETAITELAGDSVLGVRVTGANFRIDGRYELLALAGTTRVRYASSSRFSHPLLALIEPLITPVAQRKLDGDFARLEVLVESAGASPRRLSHERGTNR